jgi:hypothetical protein
MRQVNARSRVRRMRFFYLFFITSRGEDRVIRVVSICFILTLVSMKLYLLIIRTTIRTTSGVEDGLIEQYVWWRVFKADGQCLKQTGWLEPRTGIGGGDGRLAVAVTRHSLAPSRAAPPTARARCPPTAPRLTESARLPRRPPTAPRHKQLVQRS